MCFLNENNFEFVSITESYAVAGVQTEGRIGPVDVQGKELQFYLGGIGTNHPTKTTGDLVISILVCNSRADMVRNCMILGVLAQNLVWEDRICLIHGFVGWFQT
jgi:hypothetical protein